MPLQASRWGVGLSVNHSFVRLEKFELVSKARGHANHSALQPGSNPASFCSREGEENGVEWVFFVHRELGGEISFSAISFPLGRVSGVV